MSLFKFLIELQNNNEKPQTELYECLIAIAMIIHFNYDKIVSEPKMMDFLVSSERVLNKFHQNFSEYTRRQIESIFIAFNILMLLFATRIYTDSNGINIDDLD